ncbi:MAG: hypothetical protein H6564_07790 [Lewinellaceae bacterium]|nr:hypothetical protein [Lewinellaceae bacterium]
MRLSFLTTIFLLVIAPSFGQSLPQNGGSANPSGQNLSSESGYWLDANGLDIRTRPAAEAITTKRLAPIPSARPSRGEGRDPDPCTPALYDGFESGSYSPTWVHAGGSYTRSVDMVDPAVGNYSLTQTGGSSHYEGLLGSFAPAQPAEMSWWVQPKSGDYAGAYVVIGDENTPSNFGILWFYYYYYQNGFRFYANGSNDILIPASINNWYFVEIRDIDWTNKNFDIYINGNLIQSNFPFRSQASTSVSRVYLYNLSSISTAKYDDINIGCGEAADPCANDTEAPGISCPGTISPAVLGPNNCSNTLPDYTPYVSVDDNCDENPAITQSPASGTVITGVQDVIVTVTATDASSNSSSCTYIVPHVDVTAPNPVCKTTTVYLNPYGYYILQDEDVLDMGLSSDNCGEVSVTSFSPSFLTCFDLGSTRSVTVNVEDESENPASCTAMITVAAGTGLPEPWDDDNIGNAGPGNSYSYHPCEYEFTINAGANNNGLGSDNMAFIEKEMCGDFELTAHIISITPNGYAGLMVRESDAAGSKMVGMYTNLSNLVRWEARVLTGVSKSVGFYNKPLPYWLRLVRQGNWFYGFASHDGITYTFVTAQQVPMSDCLDIGLTAFSNIPGSVATAVFGDVNCGEEEEGPGIVQLPATEVDNGGIARNISLYPNPARDVVTLTRTSSSELLLGEATYSNQKIGGTVRLRNELGQILETRQLDEPLERLGWDVSQLRPGLYFMEVLEEGQAPQVLRFVKAE